MKQSSLKTIFACISGTSLQWYDFALFGYFAPIIADTYFPANNHYAAILSAFAVLAVGYFLAPLGSLFFGYIGDRWGRKKALTLSILAMAIPTALIAIVPGYAVLGFLAPCIITVLRMIQGFVASAEFTSSTVFLIEHAKEGKKALYGCLSSSSYSIGLILAGVAASFFTAEFMPVWAWRLGFLIAIGAGILIFIFRKYLEETPEFCLLQEKEKSTQPLMLAIKQSSAAMMGVLGISWLVGIMTFGTYVFTATYLTEFFHFSLSRVSLIITLALLVDACLEPLVAILAEKIGYLTVTISGIILMCLATVPIFHCLSSGVFSRAALGLVLMSMIIAIVYAPLNAYMILLFPKNCRSTGFGVSYHLGITLFGSTTPLIMIFLIEKTGNVLAPAGYYIYGSFVALVSLLVCERSRNRELSPSNAIAAY